MKTLICWSPQPLTNQNSLSSYNINISHCQETQESTTIKSRLFKKLFIYCCNSMHHVRYLKFKSRLFQCAKVKKKKKRAAYRSWCSSIFCKYTEISWNLCKYWIFCKYTENISFFVWGGYPLKCCLSFEKIPDCQFKDFIVPSPW